MSFLRVLGCMFFQGRWSAEKVDLQGKHIVVTGPTKGGIGYETAAELASWGATLTLIGRKEAVVKAAAEAIQQQTNCKPIDVVVCDLSDLSSVRGAAVQLKSKKVDVLICNAGMHSNECVITKDGVELTFAVCALSHHLLLQQLEPKRLVWVSGDIYILSNGMPNPKLSFQSGHAGGQDAYARACLARLLLAREHTKRSPDMEVIAVHPGVIATNFVSGYGNTAKWLAQKLLLSPAQGAQSSILAATIPFLDVPECCRQGPLLYFHNKRKWVNLPAKDLASDDAAASTLFVECQELCGLNPS